MKAPCLEPGCPSLASPTGRGRCAAHAQDRDRQIDRAGRGVYNTKRWRMTRKAKLHQTSLCERCGAIANTVHHRQDLAQGGDPYSLANTESLCSKCHNSETRMRQIARTK
jgi:5-methylcytosine-specific restriction endonuclease McrA